MLRRVVLWLVVAGGCLPCGACVLSLPTRRLDRAVTRAVSFLATIQQPSGGFPSLMCADEALTRCREDHTPFVTTFVLEALAPLADREPARTIAQRGREFLRAVQEPEFVWRYWTPDDELRDALTPDLDDTACARAVLLRYGEGARWSLEPLLRHQTPSGGFYTWMQVPPEKNVVDCSVNANILYYLSLERAAPDSLVAYLRKQLPASQAGSCSTFYQSPLALYYLMARAIRVAQELTPLTASVNAETLAHRRDDGSFGSLLETSLAASTLLALNVNPEAADAAIEQLLRSQLPNGAFPAIAFYRGPQGCTTNCRYFGSEPLTTALALDALIAAQSRRTPP